MFKGDDTHRPWSVDSFIIFSGLATNNYSEDIPEIASFNAPTTNHGNTPHWIRSSSDAISIAPIEPGQGFNRHTSRA